MKDSNFRLDVFKKASLCRNFEEEVIKYLNNKTIKIPAYVSAGQEFISSTISVLSKKKKIKAFTFWSAQMSLHLFIIRWKYKKINRRIIGIKEWLY